MATGLPASGGGGGYRSGGETESARLSLALDYAPYCPLRERSAERLRFLPIVGSAHDGAPWGQDAHGAGAESLRRVVSAGYLCASLLAGSLALQGPLPTVRGPDCQF